MVGGDFVGVEFCSWIFKVEVFEIFYFSNVGYGKVGC